ncbi:MAG: hypothetical protein AAGD01_06880 [Acidobacteriota bacterium]
MGKAKVEGEERLPRATRRAIRRRGLSRALGGRLLRAAVFSTLCLAMLPLALFAQAQSASSGFELDTATQRSLRDVVDASIQWHRAFLQNDADGVDRELGALVAQAQALGVERLPDVAASALLRAHEAAKDGDFVRAAWGLEAAEQLDPGTPELAFARAAVEWEQGSYPLAVVNSLQGYWQLWTQPTERSLWLHNLALWCWLSLLVAGALWLVVQVGRYGGAIAGSLNAAFARALPAPLVILLLLILGLAPLAFPLGLLWWFALWSVLLWGLFNGAERSVLVFVWLLVAAFPAFTHWQQQQVSLTLSPELRAVEALDQDRLYGDLFADLESLQDALPESRQVSYLVADLHRTLGQWESARNHYGAILDEEPEHLAALNNLGVYFFYQEDFGRASEYFQRATDAQADNALVFFNLNRSFSSRYLLADAQTALERAQRLDPSGVNQWLSQVDVVSVLELPAAETSRGIIRRELAQRTAPATATATPEEPTAAAPSSGESAPNSAALELADGDEDLSGAAGSVTEAQSEGLPWLGWAYGPLFLVGIVLAGALLSPITGRGASEEVDLGEGLDLLLRVLVPGLPSLREDRPWLGYVAIWPLSALLLLPIASRWAYRIPWDFAPGQASLGVLVTLGLVLLLLLRLLQQRRADL